jgi:hypothetical protein
MNLILKTKQKNHSQTPAKARTKKAILSFIFSAQDVIDSEINC